MAPYVLPTFTAFSVLLGPLFPPRFRILYAAWVGLTLGYHTWSTLRETRLAWSSGIFPSAGNGEMTPSDVARRGFVFSALYIATVTTAIHGLLISIFLTGYRGVATWWSHVWPTTRIFSLWLLHEGAAARLWLLTHAPH